jgi:hypothetical protein
MFNQANGEIVFRLILAVKPAFCPGRRRNYVLFSTVLQAEGRGGFSVMYKTLSGPVFPVHQSKYMRTADNTLSVAM